MRLIVILLFIGVSFVSAVEISTEQAQKVVSSFISKSNSEIKRVSSAGYALAYTCKSKQLKSSHNETAKPLYYIFNAISGKGFIIVSADDRVSPVFAFSTESVFDTASIPLQISNFMLLYEKNIAKAIEQNLAVSEEKKLEWASYLSGTSAISLGNGIAPLIFTTWDQGKYYNTQCPVDQKSADMHVPTGCVATAMAQIMKYWNYPSVGVGAYSYVASQYGIQQANFGASTYDWSKMNDNLIAENTEVAKLMYHCGVSVKMNYSTLESGAQVIAKTPNYICSESAFKNYFNYSTAIKGYIRDTTVSNANWLGILKNEIINGRPVLYAGYSEEGGHAFIFDGFDNDFFHVNWGWGGRQNGYFLIDDLNKFNSGQEVLVNIKPKVENVSEINLKLAKNIWTSLSKFDTITPGTAFTIYDSISNTGTNSFNGKIVARIFDSKLIPIITSTESNIIIDANKKAKFTSSPISIKWQGEYYVYLYYRDALSWKRIGDNDSFKNGRKIVIKSIDSVQLVSNYLFNRSVIYKKLATTVKFSLLNTSKKSINSNLRVTLSSYDGRIDTILTTKLNVLFPASNTITDYSVDFKINRIGRYKFYVEYLNGLQWVVVGSPNFENSIDMYVMPEIVNDTYEPNNTFKTSTNLTPYFIGNQSNTLIPATITPSDSDYYKVYFPESSNYTYSLKIRANDIHSNDDRVTYAADVKFCYSLDGKLWSDTIDNVVKDSVMLKVGGYIYFKVLSADSKLAGNYSLNIKTSVFVPAKIDKSLVLQSITLYPNPANQSVSILGLKDEYAFKILNTVGQVVSLGRKGKNDVIDIRHLPNAVYFVVIETSEGQKTIKLIKN